MTKLYYVYRVEFPDSTYYIGYRGSKKAASDDFLVTYFSSSKIVAERMKRTNEYFGTIIYKDLEKGDAYEREQKLIHEHINDPLCLNQVCYYKREGFGVISDAAKEKLSVKSKARWKDPEYKERLRAAHKARWAANPELKERQVARLKGKKRPEHSAALAGRPGHTKCKGVPKPKGHGAKVSASTKGVPKSEAAKQKMSGPKPRVCRLTDRKELSVNHYTRWINSLLLQEERV